jgi:hypothetical protein
MAEKIPMRRRKSQLAVSMTCQRYLKNLKMMVDWVESKKAINTIERMSNKIQHGHLEVMR